MVARRLAKKSTGRSPVISISITGRAKDLLPVIETIAKKKAISMHCYDANHNMSASK